ncbi:MAG: hypothetical protein U9Q74_01625 [Gemmatimonadota bacterium]|nr:hypothetical protein [Gemmatimonadota bacterium]
MPVTARLSKLFYERMGEQVANELVDWFNTVDATYRADLRELNELNFARFDAKLEQRLAEFELKLEQRLAQFELKIEQRLAQFELKIEQRIAALEQRVTRIEVTMERRFAEQTRWIVGLWATTMLAIIGLYFRG